jgi:hypothetical protein
MMANFRGRIEGSGVISTGKPIVKEDEVTPQEISIPNGFCHCGCGGKTRIAAANCTSSRSIKGEPRRFIYGHQRRIRPVIEEAQPFKLDGIYCRLIPLTQGQYAIVWASDYEWLMQWK